MVTVLAASVSKSLLHGLVFFNNSGYTAAQESHAHALHSGQFQRPHLVRIQDAPDAAPPPVRAAQPDAT